MGADGPAVHALVTAMLVATLAAQPGDSPPPAVPMASALQAALDEWARVPGHLGVSASVIVADGAQWIGVAGRSSDEEPLAPDHLIQMGSITKTMTAAVVLQLVDEGVLRLDDTLDRWLAPRTHVDGAITLRQLLNHTNGLANYTATPALRDALAAADAAHVFSPDELLSLIGPPVATPGQLTQYTNTAFLLLTLVAEAATGRSIVDLYRQRLWAPLDLAGVFMPGLEEPPGPVAQAQGTTRSVMPLEHLPLLSIGHGAFGLLATAYDVARWGHALFTGAVVSPEMQAAMRELMPAAGNIPGETGVGLGIRGYSYLDRHQIGHSGGAAFGSSLLLHDQSAGVTIVVMMNQGQGAWHFQLAERLLQLVAPSAAAVQ